MAEQKRLRVYSLSTCPACKKVKSFLDANSVIYENIEVDLLDSGEQWLTSKELKKYNPAATFPTVVVEEVIIGNDEEALKKAIQIK